MTEQIENAADVWVRDLFGEVYFTLEPIQCMRPHEQFRTNRFERDLAVQFQVLGFVNFSHATMSEKTHHAKTRCQHLPGSEGLRGWRGKLAHQITTNWAVEKLAAGSVVG